MTVAGLAAVSDQCVVPVMSDWEIVRKDVDTDLYLNLCFSLVHPHYLDIHNSLGCRLTTIMQIFI